MNHAQRQLREEMARAGLEFTLDDAKAPIAPMPVAVIAEPEVDRAEVREVLVKLGAPASDLEWLVANCPSVAHALTYSPPEQRAWCPKCQGPQPEGSQLPGLHECRGRL